MKIPKLLLSTRITLVLLVAFAVSMAVATFIENDHGTPVARGLIYDAWWFELILIWMSINFVAHINHYKLFHPKRWAVGLFHIAFIIILVGAGITRYFSQEGIMRVRQGQAVDKFFTTEKYLQIHELNSGKSFEQNLLLLGRNFKPYSIKADLNEETFQVIFEEYITGAIETFQLGENTFIDIAVAIGGERKDYMVDQGRYIQMGNITLTTKNDPSHPIKIYKENEKWFIDTEVPLQLMEMSSQKMGTVNEGEKLPLQLRTLYQWEEGAFLIKSIHENSSLGFTAETDEKIAKNLSDVIRYKVLDKSGNLVKEDYVKLVSIEPKWSIFQLNGKNYQITYGPKAIQLPFSLYLNEFELERYPGSQSPSSYASEVMVMDGKEEFPYRIFMNNVLDYNGFRFYQSSYDTDEKGTILSVNQDRPGTYITYLGYALLTIGMFFTLFIKGSRFTILNKKVSKIKNNETAAPLIPIKILAPFFLILLVLIFYVATFSHKDSKVQNPKIIPQSHAHAYGNLIVQDLDGRMKPLNTLANEIVRKISGKSYIEIENDFRLSPEQFLLSLQLNPKEYSEIPIIKIDKEKSLEVFQKLNISPAEKVSFMDFVDEEGKYKIQDMVEEANQLKPSQRNETHKELLKTDERFNIFYGLFTGDFLRLFPNKLDHNNTWSTGFQTLIGFDEEDAFFVKNITPLYLQSVQKGLDLGDWEEAEETLSYIALYQQKAGAEVYPNPIEIKAELLYTQLNIGSKLFGPFWIIGVFMLILAIGLLFYRSPIMEKCWQIGTWLSWMGLIIFTFHLGLRWFIAKHPPWSDGFEMLIFVAWGVLLFGLIFSNKSKFTTPLGLLFSGTLLFVGFLDWLNPEITNLMPVLHSYWLKIHVAVIVSGYAPLALSAIIGLLSLIFIIFKPKKTENTWLSNIRELQIVNEMSIAIGLFLLTIGTFLGGIWANESWGRYWAWDPKETWALISVIVYAIVLHLRLVPNLKSSLYFNLASLWAFSTIIMTSFGVNYYLSGLHSYAKGDPVPVPQWVYWVVLILFIITIVAIFKFKNLKENEKKALLT